MIERGCAAEMIGDCEGRWCKDPRTGVTDEGLLDACKWPEKLLVTVTTFPAVDTREGEFLVVFPV